MLLEVANRPKDLKGRLDLTGFMARYGYRFEDGARERIPEVTQ